MSASTLVSTPVSAANSEDIIIKNRLLFDPRTMKKSLKKFLAIGFGEHMDESLRKELLEEFLADLDSTQVFIERNNLVDDMTVRESVHFEQERLRIETEIADAQADIERLKEELIQAQVVRQNKIEYEAISKEIHKLPSREHTEKQINNTLEEIEQAGIEKIEIEEAKQLRIKHFMSVVAAIYEFQAMFNVSSETVEETKNTGRFGRNNPDVDNEEEGAYSAEAEEDEEGAIPEDSNAMDTS
ncbi:hypothetical protein QVD99_007078 [Batrachochytrium dendrobatidis]|nr:hypothetical protein O5D80_007647 [Batrachochytrium dendrobatidis]KAK5666318.1 hypothetical protein QVD99_007078 [Batrachochytrium dendrobatidis]